MAAWAKPTPLNMDNLIDSSKLEHVSAAARDKLLADIILFEAGPPSPSPALSPTSGAVQVVDFQDMLVIDNNLDLIQKEPNFRF
ncbi:Hypothetical predicted protein [Mytilus galloprovincialis]|nr:Hypothetical predicted protein [Mytilus galloprovincialis]